MIKYAKVKSTIKPKDIDIRETKVFTASNIQEVSENAGDENKFTGYEYDWTEYEKDEYILLQSQKYSELEDRLSEAQLALCEIYESTEV